MVFIIDGSHVRIPGLSIAIDETGEVEADPVVLHLAYDTWDIWLGMGIERAASAMKASAEVDQAHAANENEAKSTALVEELRTSMAAAAFGTFAVEAFYAAVVERAPVPDSLQTVWKAKSAARSTRVFESLRRSFKFSNGEANYFRQGLEEVFRFRDWAVHPPADFQPAVLHPRLHVGVPVQFIRFRYRNAALIVLVALALIRHCGQNPKARATKGVREWLPAVQEKSDSLSVSWLDVGLPPDSASIENSEPSLG